MKRVFTLICWMIGSGVFAQSLSVKGTVVDSTGGLHPVEWVRVTVSGETEKATLSAGDGTFRINGLPPGIYSITLEHPHYLKHSFTAELSAADKELGNIGMEPYPEKRITKEFSAARPVMETEAALSDDEYNDNTEVYEPLTAYGDLFSKLTSYNFSNVRYRPRGYENRYTGVYFEGADMRDVTNGGILWSVFSGLNEITKNKTASVGLKPDGYINGGIGGVQSIHARPSSFDPLVKASYSLSNRDYAHRLMFTAASGSLKKGWAFLFSGSIRHGNYGYADGIRYASGSMFGAVEKVFGEHHRLSLSFLYAPQEKGSISAATKETFDLAQTRYYNSYWGYDANKKRNSRIKRYRQPMLLLNHTVRLSPSAELSSTASYRWGENGYSALAWSGSASPYPDYYKYLPGYVYDYDEKDRISKAWRDDVNTRQLNWQNLRGLNVANTTTLEQVSDGGLPATVTGARSQYIVENRINDVKEYFFGSTLRISKTPAVYAAGVEFISNRTGNYKKVEDLLDGGFWMDYDYFSTDKPQSNGNEPDRVVRTGDIFGYRYDIRYYDSKLWANAAFQADAFRGYAGMEARYSTFWRDGKYEKETLPGALSYGKSDRFHYYTYNIKTGGTYFISPKSRAELHFAFMTLPQKVSDSFISPAFQNNSVEDVESEQISSAEADYYFADHRLSFKATVYASFFKNQTQISRMYNDLIYTYTDVVLSRIDKDHFGMELAAEYLLSNRFSVAGALALGKYIYSSNPSMRQYSDMDGSVVNEAGTVYWNALRVPGTPQTIASIGLNVNTASGWFGQWSYNYSAGHYISMNPLRRTKSVYNYLREDEIGGMSRQEKFPPAFTVDFFGGKSFRMRGGQYLSITLSLGNILNDQHIISGGYEQNRLSRSKRSDGTTTLDPFDSKYYYAAGINCFLSVSCRF